jgi:hypothetical protein
LKSAIDGRCERKGNRDRDKKEMKIIATWGWSWTAVLQESNQLGETRRERTDKLNADDLDTENGELEGTIR